MTKYLASLVLFLSVSLTTSIVFAADQYDPNWFANDLAQRGLIRDYSSTPEKYQLSGFITKKEVLQMSLKIIAQKTPKGYICKGYMKHPKMLKGEKSQLCGVIERAIDLGIFGRGADLSHLDEKMDIKKAIVVLAKSVNFQFPFSVFYPFGSASEMSDADILMSFQRT